MTTRPAAVLLSVAFHCALVLSLAVLAAPGGKLEPAEPARVTLRLTRPEPPRRSSAAATTGAQGQRVTPPAAEREQTPAPSGTSSAGPAPSIPASVRPAPSRPTISELSSSYGRTAELAASLPALPERIAGAGEPRARAPAAAFAAPGPAAPVREPPRREQAASPRARTPLAAPLVRPDPRDLVGEMQAATDAQTVAPGEAPSTSANGTIEREIGVSGRSLLVQPGMPFPSVLLTQGREADVVVRIRIRADGSIAQTEVTQPSGDSRVDVAVESVVREYLFNSVEGGTIGEGTVTFHFRLKRGF